MIYDILPCSINSWLYKLGEGWKLACLWDELPIADFTGWNGGGYWPVVLLRRDAK